MAADTVSSIAPFRHIIRSCHFSQPVSNGQDEVGDKDKRTCSSLEKISAAQRSASGSALGVEMGSMVTNMFSSHQTSFVSMLPKYRVRNRGALRWGAYSDFRDVRHRNRRRDRRGAIAP